MYQNRAGVAGEFPIHLRFVFLLNARTVPAEHCRLEAIEGFVLKGRVRMFSRRLFIAAIAAAALLAGCSDFNTNLTNQTPFAFITSISPAHITAGSTGLTLEVTASPVSAFQFGDVVMWNGVAKPTVAETASLLVATITAADIATPGKVQVSAFRPGINTSTSVNNPQAAISPNSNIIMLTIDAPGPAAPTITSLAPSSIAAGSAAFTLTVTGSNFASGSLLYWNGSPITPNSVTGATTMAVTIPAANVAAAGSANVAAYSPPPGGGTSPSVIFTITSASGNASTKGAPSGSVVDLQRSSPGVSADQRFVVFTLASADGLTELPGAIQNVFLRDTCANAPAGCAPSTTLISAAADGSPADGDSLSPSISADGRYIAFVSRATNLVSNDTNGVADVFFRDTCFGAAQGCVPVTLRVSVATDSSEANDASQSASISATGRYIIFRSSATNLDPASPPGASDLFIRDTCSGAPSGCIASTTRLALAH